jgi:hypothetical protein
VSETLAALVCGHGLGHFRRTLQIVNALLARASIARADIFSPSWQVRALAGWPVCSGLIKHPAANFIEWNSPLGWLDSPAPSFWARLQSWGENLAALKLDAYDLVISDNLVEAMSFAPRAVLSGSFLWHDLYQTAFPDDPGAMEYAKTCRELLETIRPPMIANRYFAMPAVMRETEAVGVGMLPSVFPAREKTADGRTGILFAGGAHQESMKAVRSCLAGASAQAGFPPEAFIRLDRRVAEGISGSPFSVFDHDADDFSTVDAVAACPGMGIITDCLSSGTPLFFLPDGHPELRHNGDVLERMGLGWKLNNLDGAVEKILATLGDAEVMRAWRSRIQALDRSGLDETADFLARRLFKSNVPN